MVYVGEVSEELYAPTVGIPNDEETEAVLLETGIPTVGMLYEEELDETLVPTVGMDMLVLLAAPCTGGFPTTPTTGIPGMTEGDAEMELDDIMPTVGIIGLPHEFCMKRKMVANKMHASKNPQTTCSTCEY